MKRPIRKTWLRQGADQSSRTVARDSFHRHWSAHEDEGVKIGNTGWCTIVRQDVVLYLVAVPG